MNPRDFKKAAPYLGTLLLAAVAFTVVDRGSLSLLVGLRSDPMDLVPGVKHRILGEVFRVRNGNGHARIINLQQHALKRSTGSPQHDYDLLFFPVLR
jgi:hypothetical protein